MTEMEELIQKMVEFRNLREWSKFHTPENLAKSIAIEAGELLENFQWGDTFDRDHVADELADVMIYCLLLAKSLEIDPATVIKEKIERNVQRFPVDKVKGTSGKNTRIKIR